MLTQLPGSEDRDPVSENVAAAMGQGIYVLPQQDHIAHLEVHLPFLKSPLFGNNPAIQRVFLYPMAMHLKDHLLNYYLVEAHDAVDKAQQSKVIQEDAPQQVEIILRVQKFIEDTLGGFGQELAQIEQAAQQFKPDDPNANDPTMKIAEMSAQIKSNELAQRAEMDNAKLQLDNMKLETQNALAAQKLAQDAEIEKLRLADKERDRQEKMDQASLAQLSETERTNIREMSETDRLATREAGDDRRKAEDLAARERMNNADNQTAKELAEMEMESEEKTSFTTGGGINPNP